jgi:hypothetical protein
MMNRRQCKKLLLGDFQEWLFTAEWIFDPANVAVGDLYDYFSGLLENDPWWMFPWKLMDEIEPGKIAFIFGSSGHVSPGYEAQQAVRSRLIADWEQLRRECKFPFDLTVGPLQADLSVASNHAPRQAERQRQSNARRGIGEFAWEPWLSRHQGCASGCDCHSH